MPVARLPRRAHHGGAVKVCKKDMMVTKTYLIYGDGSFKAPAHDPNGRERAGWGVAKFEVVQVERSVMLKPVYNLGGRVVTPNSSVNKKANASVNVHWNVPYSSAAKIKSKLI